MSKQALPDPKKPLSTAAKPKTAVRPPVPAVQHAAQPPGPLTPEHAVQLQRHVGNTAVSRLVRQQTTGNRQQATGNGRRPPNAPFIQPKLTVNAVGDKYEQEADAVAKEIMKKLNAPKNEAAAGVPTAPPRHAQRQTEEEELTTAQHIQRQEMDEEEMMLKHVQRQEIPEEEMQLQRQEIDEEEPALAQRQDVEEEEIAMPQRIQRQELDEKELPEAMAQREAVDDEEDFLQTDRTPTDLSQGGPINPDIEQRIDQQQGGGQPLDEAVYRPMGNAFGMDFSDVRVHTNAESHDLNESLRARAFTTGRDIFFKEGEYSPSSLAGKQLLAHELTHVVQQQFNTIASSRLYRLETREKSDNRKQLAQIRQVEELFRLYLSSEDIFFTLNGSSFSNPWINGEGEMYIRGEIRRRLEKKRELGEYKHLAWFSKYVSNLQGNGSKKEWIQNAIHYQIEKLSSVKGLNSTTTNQSRETKSGTSSFLGKLWDSFWGPTGNDLLNKYGNSAVQKTSERIAFAKFGNEDVIYELNQDGSVRTLTFPAQRGRNFYQANDIILLTEISYREIIKNYPKMDPGPNFIADLMNLFGDKTYILGQRINKIVTLDPEIGSGQVELEPVLIHKSLLISLSDSHTMSRTQLAESLVMSEVNTKLRSLIPALEATAYLALHAVTISSGNAGKVVWQKIIGKTASLFANQATNRIFFALAKLAPKIATEFAKTLASELGKQNRALQLGIGTKNDWESAVIIASGRTFSQWLNSTLGEFLSTEVREFMQKILEIDPVLGATIRQIIQQHLVERIIKFFTVESFGEVVELVTMVIGHKNDFDIASSLEKKFQEKFTNELLSLMNSLFEDIVKSTD
jgi:hypothetical protein